jgi:hypothetical protein
VLPLTLTLSLLIPALQTVIAVTTIRIATALLRFINLFEVVDLAGDSFETEDLLLERGVASIEHFGEKSYNFLFFL